jgi:hypothetical protein
MASADLTQAIFFYPVNTNQSKDSFREDWINVPTDDKLIQMFSFTEFY